MGVGINLGFSHGRFNFDGPADGYIFTDSDRVILLRSFRRFRTVNLRLCIGKYSRVFLFSSFFLFFFIACWFMAIRVFFFLFLEVENKQGFSVSFFRYVCIIRKTVLIEMIKMSMRFLTCFSFPNCDT